MLYSNLMQKGLGSFQIIIGIFIIFMLVIGAYYFGRNTSTLNPTNDTKTTFQPTNNANTNSTLLIPQKNKNPITTSVVNFTYIKNGDVYVFDLSNNQTKKLTNYGYNTSPILSPDGSKVAYLSVPEAVVKSGEVQKFAGSGLFQHPISLNGEYNVWIINSDGTDPIKVTNSLKSRSNLSWYSGYINTSYLLLFKEDNNWIRYDLRQKNQSASSLSEEDLPTYMHNSGYYAYLTNNGKTLNVQPTDGYLKTIDHPYKIITLDWSKDNRYALFTSVDDSERTGLSTLGLKYAIWYYDSWNNKIEAITSYKERNHSPKISPDNTYIATLQGTGYADAGNIDLRLAIIKVTNFVVQKTILLSDFKGSDYFEKHKGFMFPVGNIVWLNNKELFVQLDALVDPQPNPRGLYKLNLENLTAERLLEL